MTNRRTLACVALCMLVMPAPAFPQTGEDWPETLLLNDQRRSVVVQAIINPDDTATVLDIYVTDTPPAGRLAIPFQLLLESFDGNGAKLDERNAWNPRYELWRDENDLHFDEIVEGVPGEFDLPLSPDLESIAIRNHETATPVAVVSVRDAVETWCYEQLQTATAAGTANCIGIEFTDTDVDTLPDAVDNCPAFANPEQTDTDGDDIGNRCDADFDNSGFVNFADLAYLKSVFGTADPMADHDGSGFVNFADLAIFKSLFGQPAGGGGS